MRTITVVGFFAATLGCADAFAQQGFRLGVSALQFGYQRTSTVTTNPRVDGFALDTETEQTQRGFRVIPGGALSLGYAPTKTVELGVLLSVDLSTGRAKHVVQELNSVSRSTTEGTDLSAGGRLYVDLNIPTRGSVTPFVGLSLGAQSRINRSTQYFDSDVELPTSTTVVALLCELKAGTKTMATKHVSLDVSAFFVLESSLMASITREVPDRTAGTVLKMRENPKQLGFLAGLRLGVSYWSGP